MKLELDFVGCLCECSEFIINGVKADNSDFGDKSDENPDEAEDYGCGDMRFTSNASTPEILEKYKITQKEYDKICDELKEGLSFGSCGWCV